MTADSTRTARSLGGGNPDVVRSQNLRIRKFSLDIDALETGFFPRNGLENDVVLIREHLLQTVQVRLEADLLGRSKREAFPASLICELGQARKANLQIPRASTGSTHSNGINGVNEDIKALTDFAGRVRIGTDSGHTVIHRSIIRSQARSLRLFATEPVDTVRDHQNFASDFLLLPAFDQADQRQIRTIHSRESTTRQSHCLYSQIMISGKVLDNVDARVRHITDTDNRRRGLSVDEILRSEEHTSELQ